MEKRTYDQSQRRISPFPSKYGISPDDSVNYSLTMVDPSHRRDIIRRTGAKMPFQTTSGAKNTTIRSVGQKLVEKSKGQTGLASPDDRHNPHPPPPSPPAQHSPLTMSTAPSAMCVIETVNGRDYKVKDMAMADFGLVPRPNNPAPETPRTFLSCLMLPCFETGFGLQRVRVCAARRVLAARCLARCTWRLEDACPLSVFSSSHRRPWKQGLT